MIIKSITERLWLYSPHHRASTLTRDTDEYGRHTLVIRLSRDWALACAYRTCYCSNCETIRQETQQMEADRRH